MPKCLSQSSDISLIAKANPKQVNDGDVKNLIETAIFAAANVVKERQGWIEDEQRKLMMLGQHLQNENELDYETGVDRVFAVGHDLRSHADYFDFPLLAKLGFKMCQALESGARPSQGIFQLFMQIALLILKEDSRGKGDDRVQALLEGFDKAIDVTSAPDIAKRLKNDHAV